MPIQNEKGRYKRDLPKQRIPTHVAMCNIYCCEFIRNNAFGVDIDFGLFFVIMKIATLVMNVSLVVPQTCNQPHCQAKKTCFVALGAIKVIVAINAATFS